ncbi:hypothetical protein [uncultured Streptococcus sp.]|nr:hypothetical protein [uncultured Streptococcus sp.]
MEKITYIELPEPKPSKELLEKVRWLAEHMFYYNAPTFPFIIRDKNDKV